jgi:hypothetical protein
MSHVEGTFKAPQKNDSQNDSYDLKESELKRSSHLKIRLLKIIKPVQIFCEMSKETITYLFNSGFGLVIFLKASGTMTWGSEDILTEAFSHVEGNEAETSRRIGDLYSSIGLGCVLGPIIANSFVVDGSKPVTVQKACIMSFAVLGIGWIGVAKAPNFGVICAFTILRSCGSAVIWINSSLILQVNT